MANGCTHNRHLFGASLRWPSFGVNLMNIQEHIPLAPFATFRIGGEARFFAEVQSLQELKQAIVYAKENNLPIFILGGGSNLLISDEGFNGLVIKISMQGMERREEGDFVFVTAGAGILWDDLVLQTVTDGLWGLENLSYIPGTVGAAPVQNIGAYGSEVKDTVHSVFVFDISSGEVKTFSNNECQFGYRDSIFKKPEGKKFVVLEVTFHLSKNSTPNLLYKDLKEFFEQKGNLTPSLSKIREAVIEIRKNKLPDWHTIGTAGSFFKNPIITTERYISLIKKFPTLPSFEVDLQHVKVPLAWILDKICGLKGFREGDVGLYEKQPLAFVNFGSAQAKDVKNLAQKISEIVKEKTDIDIEWEVMEVKN